MKTSIHKFRSAIIAYTMTHAVSLMVMLCVLTNGYAQTAMNAVSLTNNYHHSHFTTNYYDAKTKLKFGITNDSNNLYIALQSYDEAGQFQLFRAGTSISIKMAVEPKNTVKLTILPVRVDDILQFEQTNALVALKERILLNKPVIEVKGMISQDITAMIADTALPMHYDINWNQDNAMIMTFQIPLKELMDMEVKWQDVLKKQNLLTVIINGLERPGEMPRQPQQQRPTSLSQGGFGREGLNPERQFGTPFDNEFSTVVSETTTLRHKFKLK